MGTFRRAFAGGEEYCRSSRADAGGRAEGLARMGWKTDVDEAFGIILWRMKDIVRVSFQTMFHLNVSFSRRRDIHQTA